MMSDYPVTLTVPEHIYERAKQIAQDSDKSVETVLMQSLESALAEPVPPLPADEQKELDALTFLSDDALWTIAREQMPEIRQARMQVLMDGNTQGTLSEQEFAELENLVDQGQRLMLRKAQAAALLTDRGYTVTANDMTAKHD